MVGFPQVLARTAKRRQWVRLLPWSLWPVLCDAMPFQTNERANFGGRTRDFVMHLLETHASSHHARVGHMSRVSFSLPPSSWGRGRGVTEGLGHWSLVCCRAGWATT